MNSKMSTASWKARDEFMICKFPKDKAKDKLLK